MSRPLRDQGPGDRFPPPIPPLLLPPTPTGDVVYIQAVQSISATCRLNMLRLDLSVRCALVLQLNRGLTRWIIRDFFTSDITRQTLGPKITAYSLFFNTFWRKIDENGTDVFSILEDRSTKIEQIFSTFLKEDRRKRNRFFVNILGEKLTKTEQLFSCNRRIDEKGTEFFSAC